MSYPGRGEYVSNPSPCLIPGEGNTSPTHRHVLSRARGIRLQPIAMSYPGRGEYVSNPSPCLRYSIPRHRLICLLNDGMEKVKAPISALLERDGE
uniref:Uncharacterized protein n=1 Tax=Globodera rostochiensis TaxID=31243 RepID=A0A914IBA1_GLORO